MRERAPTVEQRQSIPRIELDGDYDLGQREALSELFEALRADAPVVIDLTKVTYIDSTLLSELVKLRNRLDGHPVTLVGANANVMRILRHVSFEKLFEIVE